VKDDKLLIREIGGKLTLSIPAASVYFAGQAKIARDIEIAKDRWTAEQEALFLAALEEHELRRPDIHDQSTIELSGIGQAKVDVGLEHALSTLCENNCKTVKSCVNIDRDLANPLTQIGPNSHVWIQFQSMEDAFRLIERSYNWFRETMQAAGVVPRASLFEFLKHFGMTLEIGAGSSNVTVRVNLVFPHQSFRQFELLLSMVFNGSKRG
jgi:hypothetical protein